MEIKEKPPEDFFKGIKTSLKSVLKHPDINLPKITNAVIKCNKIVIQTMMFMKLFLLDHYDKYNKLPVINDEFINSCMKILCNEKLSGRPPKKEIKELKDNLTAFYKTEFQPLIQNENLDYTHMNTILDYLTIDILTMYENNIKLHYVEYVERYVNVIWKKKFSKIQLELKQEKINEKTIIEWETEISKFNRKSLTIPKFKEYIKKKSEINGMLFTFYEKYIFRKLRLQSYRNTKRSEQKMLNNFKRIFGNEKDIVVCFGDYEQKKQMKFKEATKGKGMRTLFRKAGFQTYLVDEFRTSCMCSKCEIGICKKTMVRENPKPYRSGNVLIHGLICCKNGCGYWNRDVNGATNIYKIAYNAINNKERPNYLSRSKNLSTGLDELVKPKFTRSAKGKPF